MAKTLETINIGIFGHIDHGKTTLLKQLSGKWASTHSEELKRGITIKLGYADTVIYNDKGKYNIDKKGEPIRHVSFIDSPGHEMLMATTLSGAALIDAAILVVAANEGIKPQTREHLITLQAKKNHDELKKFLGEEYKDAEIIPISAQQNANVDEILKKITELPIPDRKPNETPIFTIARSFDINKPGTKPEDLHGTVLGGTLKQGKLKIGDKIEIKPGRPTPDKKYVPIKTKIKSLFKGSQKVEELTPGGSMSIETSLDMSLGKSDSLGGNLVSLEGKLPEPETKVKIKHTLFPEVFGLAEHQKIESIKKGETLMLSINTTTTGGSVMQASDKEISLNLKIPAVLFKGDNVGIARSIAGHWRLIGYGEII